MRARALLIMLVLPLISCAALTGSPAATQAAQQARQNAFIIKPYVNWVDTSSAHVVWVSGPQAPAGSVTARCADQEVKAGAGATPIAGRAELLHVATLKGLRAGARYEYSASCGAESEQGAFRTAPAGAVPIRFAVYGDTRSNPDDHAAVSRAIAAERPEFVAHTGDFVSDGAVWELWRPEFFGPARPFLQDATFWPVRGNHEGDAVLYRALFVLPGNELYYSFDYGNVHFIVLDSQLGGRQREAMVRWLEKDLARTDAEWILASYHIPTFNVGGHGSKWGREDVLPVLEKGGVDFVLNGHSHVYERFLPIGPVGEKPIIHVVTGGGGAPRYSVRASPILVGGIGLSMLNYCVFEVDGDHLKMTAKMPDGSVLDELKLVKHNGRFQDEIMAQAVETKWAEGVISIFANVQADFETVPKPGEKVNVILSGGFPNGAKVALQPAGGPGGWAFEPCELTAADGKVRFQARVPQSFHVNGISLAPPLRLNLTVTAGAKTWKQDNLTAQVPGPVLSRLTPTPEAVPLPPAPEGVVVDGDLSEWQDVSPLPLPFHNGEVGPVRLCWSSRGLYGALSATDASVKANPDSPWTADSLELFIDKACARKLQSDDGTAQYVFSPAPQGQGVLIPHGVNQNRTDAVKCAWLPVEGGYAMEFMIPADFLAPARMEAGSRMGLNFCLNDDGRPVRQFYSDKRNNGWHTPFGWGIVVLSK